MIRYLNDGVSEDDSASFRIIQQTYRNSMLNRSPHRSVSQVTYFSYFEMMMQHFLKFAVENRFFPSLDDFEELFKNERSINKHPLNVQVGNKPDYALELLNLVARLYNENGDKFVNNPSKAKDIENYYGFTYDRADDKRVILCFRSFKELESILKKMFRRG